MPRFVHRVVPYTVLAASVCLIGMMRLMPQRNHPIAAVFPLWWSVGRTFAAAAQTGGAIVRFGGLLSIVVLVPDSSDPAPDDLARHLHEAGAWLLLDAQALTACALTS